MNLEVIHAHGPVAVTSLQIEDWQQRAQRSPRKRFRLCAHESPDPIHEMLICLDKETYVRPHKHIAKSESIHVISGLATLIFFDESGQPTETIALGPYQSGRTFFFRTAQEVYHTLFLESDSFVFHETTVGPFDPTQTVYAEWAPREDDPLRWEYLKQLQS